MNARRCWTGVCPGPGRVLSRLLVVLPMLALVLGARAEVPEPYNSDPTTQRPLAPEEAASRWRFPEGFRVSVFASEPEVRQPIAMALDDRGRLWVAECYTYSEARKGFDATLRDRIVIFEDQDGDGRFDRRTVFAENLERLSSLEVGFGGVWALTSPTLVFLPDRDRDDRPDGPAEVCLDGFDWKQNHHTMANGLKWGPDGWLYGRHGIQAVSSLGRPGTAQTARARTNGGIWRYHPQRREVEIVCHGTTNPWGMDWNELGEPFFINTVIGHLWHMIPGAHYRRMHGVDLNPNAFEVIDHHADHLHWASGEAWNSWQKLGTTDATSAAGGGHAHTGLMFYAGDNWPAAWRGKVFTINFHGRRLNVEALERSGSGYVGRHQPDVGFAADTWFRGIDLVYGPDGGVFIADWSDTGECHESDGVFRQSGRIYKVTYGQPARPLIPDVARLSPVEWVGLLGHTNEFFARHARRCLQERAALGEDLGGVRALLLARFGATTDPVQQLRALWSLVAVGGADPAWLRSQLTTPNESVRAWVIRLLVDDPARVAAEPIIAQRLAGLAAEERSARVRLELASALQRLPLDQRLPVALALVRRGEDAADHNIPLMVWYGIEGFSGTSLGVLAELGEACLLPATRRCISRRLILSRGVAAGPMERLLAWAASTPAWQEDVLAGMKAGLESERSVVAPAGWATAGKAFAASGNPKVRELFMSLGAVFGDPAALEALRAVVLDSGVGTEARRSALRQLIQRRVDRLRPVCEAVLTVPGLAVAAMDGLALETDPGVVDWVVARWGEVPVTERSQVLSSLLSRGSWAARVLDAVGEGRLKASDLGPFHARQIRGFKEAGLEARLTELWGRTKETDADKANRIQYWKQRLGPDLLSAADRKQGRVVYNTLCGACHVLNGEGGRIGPELTGSGRDNLEYLLHNIVDPSAAVPREYQLVTVNTTDGRSLSGFIRSRDARTLVLQTLTEAVSIPAAEISSTQSSTLSLMPEGLLEALSEAEVRNLFAYLMAR